MKYRVYFNLRKKCFSVQKKSEKGSWIVCEHRKEIALRNVNFKVSEVGRQRVLKRKRKNVHAFVEGEIERDFVAPPRKFHQVSYNPYKLPFFFTFQKKDSVFISGDPIPIHYADLVYMVVEENKPEIYAFDVDFNSK